MAVEEALEATRRQGAINAIVTVNEAAPAEARELELRGLEPVPVAVKDIIYTKGLRTTMGSRIFANFVPIHDAAVISKLKRAGMVVIGKTNTHEFASGVTTTSSIFGPTRNPLDLERIAGGSSGGSAAAVAAGIVDLALGTDTAGSIRIPASLCGVYGFRPSPGLVPKSGFYPLAPTFDQVGVLASSLKWLRLGLEAIASKPARRSELPRRPRVGVPVDLIAASDAVRRAFWDAVTALDYVEVRLPRAERDGVRAFTIIRLSEASKVHLPLRDRWSEYFPDVRRLLEKGLQFSAVDYVWAMDVMKSVRLELVRAMTSLSLDAIILPSTAIEAPRLEDVIGREDGEVRNLLTGNTWLASLTGAPAISVPALRVNNLPVGLQLVGRPGADWELLAVAEAVEEAVGSRPARRAEPPGRR